VTTEARSLEKLMIETEEFLQLAPAEKDESLSDDLRAELAKLQTECDPLPFDKVKEALAAIYGDDLSRVFSEIDPKPLGSASLAQVHKGWLKSGDLVAEKNFQLSFRIA